MNPEIILSRGKSFFPSLPRGCVANKGKGVIPAKARRVESPTGIQCSILLNLFESWMPASAGMTNYDTVSKGWGSFIGPFPLARANLAVQPPDGKIEAGSERDPEKVGNEQKAGSPGHPKETADGENDGDAQDGDSDQPRQGRPQPEE